MPERIRRWQSPAASSPLPWPTPCRTRSGIHIAEESLAGHSARHVWPATLATFATKFFMALTFMVPILLFELGAAIGASMLWGFAVLTFLSLRLARAQCVPAWKVAGEHLLIATIVVVLTHLLGEMIAQDFGPALP